MKKKKKKGVMFSDILEEYCEENNSNVKKKTYKQCYGHIYK